MKAPGSGDQFGGVGIQDVEIVPHWYMYPPKGCYKDRCDYDRFSDELAGLSGPVNLYIHIPFCAMKCSFCTLFASIGVNRSSVTQYIDALLEEITLLSSKMNPRSVIVRNLYIGGGTPSILSEKDLRRLFEHLHKTFALTDCSTISVEFSPDTVDRTSAALWMSLGVTRASLGVQSFSDPQLRSMRRKHTANDTRTALETLLAIGFVDLNIDLIYGHISQDVDQWRDDLGAGLKCGATSITIHPLAIRESTGYTVQLYKPEVPRPTPRFPDLYGAALASFTDNGWSPTSSVSFSNRDFGNPLEEAEADGIPTLGLGAGARTYLSRLHTSSISYGNAVSFGKTLERYYHAIRHGLLPIVSRNLLK